MRRLLCVPGIPSTNALLQTPCAASRRPISPAAAGTAPLPQPGRPEQLGVFFHHPVSSPRRISKQPLDAPLIISSRGVPVPARRDSGGSSAALSRRVPLVIKRPPEPLQPSPLFSGQGGRIRPMRGSGCPLRCHCLPWPGTIPPHSRGVPSPWGTGVGDWGWGLGLVAMARSVTKQRASSRVLPSRTSSGTRLPPPSCRWQGRMCLPSSERLLFLSACLQSTGAWSRRLPPRLPYVTAGSSSAGSAGSSVPTGPGASHRLLAAR